MNLLPRLGVGQNSLSAVSVPASPNHAKPADARLAGFTALSLLTPTQDHARVLKTMHATSSALSNNQTLSSGQGIFPSRQC
ncbi:hypothetical protein AWB67_00975 [Caballeronia terrestris]|uniref:Uncharacterized protein n=1 Tax=Caballeronia terrestris TaxID=1226301 RepID=A0A158FZ98_9BURK|nr:hypothetical protein [Caballeronia terrestris]SAL24983.1 hypothetical protein AWB67_00975 [Caballeronia terrestris]